MADIKRIIRLVLDKRSADKVERDIEDVAERSSGKMAAAFRRTAGILAGLFALDQIVGGIQNVVRAANDLEKANRKLAGTAHLTGLNLSFLDANARNVETAFGLSRQQAVQLTSDLANLGVRAGDVSKLGESMGAFLDIAAARGLDATDALQAISEATRSVDSNTQTLFAKSPAVLFNEYAVSINKTANQLTQADKAAALLWAALRDGETVRGRFREWLETAQGQTFLLNIQLERSRARLGQALLPLLVKLIPVAIGVTKNITAIAIGFERVTVAVERADFWFRRLAESLRAPFSKQARDNVAEMTARLEQLAVRAGELRAEAVALRRGDDQELVPTGDPGDFFLPVPEPGKTAKAKKARKEELNFLQKRIDLLVKGKELGQLTDIDFRQAQELFIGLQQALQEGNLSLEGRVELMERLRELQTVLGVAGGVTGPGEFQTQADRIAKFRKQFAEMEQVGTNAAFGVAGAWQDAFGVLFSEARSLGGVFEALFRGIGGAAFGALAQLASGKIAENIARAVEEQAKAAAALASFNPVSAALHTTAAKGHIVAAAKWAVLGGAAGAAQAGVAGGGRGGLSGGVPTGARDIGGRITDRQQAGAGELHIHLDGVDPNNPRHQRLLAQSTYNANRRGLKVTVHDGGTR